MDPISMLHPDSRCVRSKIALFLRLWRARQRYEQLRPFGQTSSECLQFHLRQLHSQWLRVLEVQKALGLDMMPFAPREQFENIVVGTGFVERALEKPEKRVLALIPPWRAYLERFGALSHEMNPFEFGDTCSQCGSLVAQINHDLEEITNKETAGAATCSPPEEDLQCSFSGRSR